MGISRTGVLAHDRVVNAAESTRQTAVAAATTQAGVRAAEVAFYRTAVASAVTNGLSPALFLGALRELGYNNG